MNKGNENFPDIHPNLEFTVGDVEGKWLWLAMDTEIRLYEYPSLLLTKTFSHPCFHNIHSVAVHGNELFVTSTGLDMVVVLNKEDGAILRYLNAEGKPMWHRFSSKIDYRKQHSTRPHDCHPNYVFWIGNEPWVTRCSNEDAVQLSDMNKRIDISGAKRPIGVHDGVVKGDRVLFTTVDGAIVVANAHTGNILETIQLSTLKGFGGLRGWCRGLHVDGDICHVGFSRLRKTREITKLNWIPKNMLKGNMIRECSILTIDLNRPKILADHRIPLGSADAVYGILPEPV